MRPEQGKTYISTKNPKLRIYVEKMSILEADEDGPESFYVEACEDRHKGDGGGGPGLEFTEEDWNAYEAMHQLTLAPS